MENALELGRLAARIKLAEDAMNLGARPAAPATPKPPASMNVSMTMPKPPPPPAPAPQAAGIGQQFMAHVRQPANMARMIGQTGALGRGVLGAVGAPGLFAISNLARGGGEMGSLLRGGIPAGGVAGGPAAT